MSLARRLAGTAAGTAVLLAAAGAAALPVASGTPAQVSSAGFQPIVAQSGSTMTVDLRANRTIIDWSSFNIANGESVTFAMDARSWIAVNRVPSGQINVNGQLNSIFATSPSVGGPPGGNVWLYSPDGVMFGPNARVNVGGLLATSSALDPNLLLVSGSLSHTFTGSGSGGPVVVAAGAELNAVGHLTLLAPVVTTAAGSTLLATHERSSITYGAADSYDIRFRLITNGDMSLVDFIVPSAAVGTNSTNPLVLAGSSQAGNIFALATGRQGLTSILISAPGLMVASSSTTGEGQVKIGVGRQMIGSDFNYLDNVQQVPGAPPGSLVMGTAQAAGYITLMMMGETALGDITATSLSGGNTVGLAARNVTISGDITGRGGGLGIAGEEAVVFDTSGLVRVGGTARSSTNVLIFRGNNQIGRSTARPDVDIASATGNQVRLFGGVVNVGTITAQTLVEGNVNSFSNTTLTSPAVSLVGLGDAPFTFGRADVTGAMSVTTNGLIRATTLNAGNLTLTTSGGLQLGATSAPTINLTSLGGTPVALGAITAATALSVTTGAAPISATSISTGALTLTSATGPINVGTIIAASLALTTAGDATLGTTTLSGGLDVTAGLARLGRTTVGTDARLQAATPDLLDIFSARNLVLEARTGSMTLGGTSQGLTNTEFQNLRLTGGFTLYGGLNVVGSARGDLTVLDLDIDPTRVPSLTLLAGADNLVRIGGVVRTSGATALRIGEAASDSVWTPKQILITGALGTAQGDATAGFTDVHAFRSVALYARDDILIGSQRFIDLVNPASPADIDIGRGLPLGVAATSDELGKLFLVAGSLQVTAGDRIVQQNTGAVGQQAGLYLTGEGVAASDPLLIIGGAQITDLFGALADGSSIASGGLAPFSTRIARAQGDTSSGPIRINGCGLGVGCFLPTPASQFRVESFRPVAVRAAIDPPVLSLPPPVDEDERQAEGVITGTGNEEIWRSKK